MRSRWPGRPAARSMPLDPSQPKARLRRIVDDADPVVVITQAALAETVPVPGTAVVSLDRETEAIGREDDGNLASIGDGSPDQLILR